MASDQFLISTLNLIALNLSFTSPARRGPIRYLPGDITQTPFPAAHFDAAACSHSHSYSYSGSHHGSLPAKRSSRETHGDLVPE